MRVPRNERVAADRSAEPGPERKCILSGSHGARAALIRLAVAPPGDDGTRAVLPDVLARAPGRGAWIGVARAELERAQAKGKLRAALARALGKAPERAGARLTLMIPADLGARIEAALARLVTDRLGLALKAGQLLLGAERIAETARAGRIAWLGHAADAGADGVRKLDQAWRVGREAEGSALAGAILPLDRAALSVALGRDNVVHLALSDAAAADRVAAALTRLTAFRGTAEAPPHGAAASAGPAAAPLAETTH